jgi:putative heme iron utilization protein
MSEIRNWLFSAQDATLCTLAAEPELEGFPFGSLTPFALRGDGTPFIYISAIAQHTKNLTRDPRCSLFVRNPAPASAGDAQATWRLTVLARARRLDATGDELEELQARYAARVPDAPEYGKSHDFGFWALTPVRLRAIGGFGAIRWHEPGELLVDPLGDGWREGAAFVIEHMNTDHEDALREIMAARTGARPEHAQITAVEKAGFLVRTQGPDALRYVPFGRDVAAKEARDVFVKLTHDARG